MKNRIDVGCEEGMASPAWIPAVEPFVAKVLSSLDLEGWELSVLFCSDDFIRNLNAQYRTIDAPTDVLSFEQGDEYVDDEGHTWFSAGDIVISLSALMRNCEDFSVTPDEELKRLLVHGILHLDGMDHTDNSPEQEMLKLQESLLESLSSERVFGG